MDFSSHLLPNGGGGLIFSDGWVLEAILVHRDVSQLRLLSGTDKQASWGNI
jgi:hypothetical protein